MIRVGFLVSLNDNHWLGGINYYRNLFYSILTNPDRKIQPVIFTGVKTDISALIQGLPSIEIVRTSLLDRFHISWIIRKVWKCLFLKDNLLEIALIKNGIKVLSHSGIIGRRSKVLTIGWIPDLQHIHLKAFFTTKEISSRTKEFKKLCKYCSYIIVSSFEAQKDLVNFYDVSSEKVKVLSFVAAMTNCGNLPHIDDLNLKYNFFGPYFHLPNQFWAHKNHLLVIDALKILKSKNRRVLIVATGNTYDYRNPNYFKTLIKYAEECEVLDQFKILGIVDYNSLITLMKNSLAIINPSLFEGWSTTVEEAKSLGKKVIISEIPVHIEQMPQHGVFFNPKSAESLANVIWSTWCSYDHADDVILMKKALENIEIKKNEFAKKFDGLILDLVSKYVR